MSTTASILQSINLAAIITWIVGTLIPLLVGLLTTANTSSNIKAVLNFVLAAAAAVGGQLIASGVGSANFDWWGTIANALITFVISGASYNHFWKPTGVARKAQLTLFKDPEPMKAGREDAELAEEGPQHAAR